jgi:hypothetical protein
MTTAPEVEHQEFQEGVLVDPESIRPNLDHVVTEDSTPVDNLFSEKQQRLLTEPLFASWPGPGAGRPFVVMANVGLFYGLFQPPLVPDTLLSLDVRFPEELWAKHHRSYFTWEYGKQPDVVIEIVSNTVGDELGRKFELYAQIGILYYLVFDPHQQLRGDVLQLFELERRSFRRRDELWLPEIGLGLRLWHGSYEGIEAEWLRWCDQDGHVVPSGAERAEQAQLQAKQAQLQAENERERADQAERAVQQERERADQERERAERLAAKLRELGIEPES